MSGDTRIKKLMQLNHQINAEENPLSPKKKINGMPALGLNTI